MVQPQNKRLVTAAEEAANDAADRAYVDQAIAAALSTPQAAAGYSNVHMQPVWDGTGAHPTRVMPANLGYEIWRQTTFPQVGPTFAQPGDDFQATE